MSMDALNRGSCIRQTGVVRSHFPNSAAWSTTENARPRNGNTRGMSATGFEESSPLSEVYGALPSHGDRNFFVRQPACPPRQLRGRKAHTPSESAHR